jgi:IPT/TIG domain
MAVHIFRLGSRVSGLWPSVGALTLAALPALGTGPTVPALTPTPPLAVSAIHPGSGPASGNTAVSVTGSGFADGASVAIGSVPAAGVAFVDTTRLDAVTPILLPGTLNDVVVTNPVTFALRPSVIATLPRGWLADFLDVPQADLFHPHVEAVFRGGITAGCGAGYYCRDDAVRRDQMAVLLLKSEHGSTYVPPPCAGAFADVACPGPFADWIEQLRQEGITGGCGNGDYCPTSSVNRAQMAVFLLKAKYGAAYTPPSCTGLFADVSCPGALADWIEELYVEGVTGGCSASPLRYCPASACTRGQAAAFLTTAFGLLTPSPTPTPTSPPTTVSPTKTFTPAQGTPTVTPSPLATISHTVTPTSTGGMCGPNMPNCPTFTRTPTRTPTP